MIAQQALSVFGAPEVFERPTFGLVNHGSIGRAEGVKRNGSEIILRPYKRSGYFVSNTDKFPYRSEVDQRSTLRTKIQTGAGWIKHRARKFAPKPKNCMSGDLQQFY